MISIQTDAVYLQIFICQHCTWPQLNEYDYLLNFFGQSPFYFHKAHLKTLNLLKS